MQNNIKEYLALPRGSYSLVEKRNTKTRELSNSSHKSRKITQHILEKGESKLDFLLFLLTTISELTVSQAQCWQVL